MEKANVKMLMLKQYAKINLHKKLNFLKLELSWINNQPGPEIKENAKTMNTQFRIVRSLNIQIKSYY
jgi:hypothetical protein